MIEFNQQDASFHLTNGVMSYIFRIEPETQILEHLYFGEAIPTYDNYHFLVERELRSATNSLYDDNYTASFEHIKQELPVYGTTDFRQPAIQVTYPQGDQISQFEYVAHEISVGKDAFPEGGLPGTHASADQAARLTVTVKDKYSDIEVDLVYTVFQGLAAISRQPLIRNKGTEDIVLNRLLSTSLEFLDTGMDILHLDGAWAKETHLKREPLHHGIQAVQSTRGASGPVHNPFLAVCDRDATETAGRVYATSLIYSGNFLAQVEVDTYDVARLQIGINPFTFDWHLGPGESFVAPEALVVFSNQGLGGMSRTWHALINQHVIPEKYAKQARPIAMNNWEATYWGFTEEKLLALAEKGAQVGCELFVLDDGWFGHRDGDNSSLGDWTIYDQKLPNGLVGLADKIHDLGLQFGLWIEPEMVSKGTPLFETHPEWVVGNPNKNISQGRNQYVLDFSNHDVVDAIFNQFDAILSGVPIDYIKWDMNRYISEPYSQGLAHQGEFFHRYILGVYDLYVRITKAYPEIMIEGCAGGGGRFDLGILCFSPHIWASDDSDAIERLDIQGGLSMLYPLTTHSNHISEVPNHQVGRVTPLKTRYDVAKYGVLGLELDLTKLSESELSTLASYIADYKQHRTSVMASQFYRLQAPGLDRAWQTVADDGSKSLVTYYQVLTHANLGYRRLRLQGLEPTARYLVNGQTTRFGSDLMSVGLLFSEDWTDRTAEFRALKPTGDFVSYSFVLEKQ
jgi:alpha-galactosidase